MLAAFLLLVALPLVPLIVVGGVVWWLVRRSRSQQANGLVRV